MCERPGLVLVRGDQWGEHICLFDRWSVVVVTRERFVARNSGKEAAGPIDAWGDWLRHLRDNEFARGQGREAGLSVHWPGCSIGWCSCKQTVEPGTRLEVIK